MTDNYHLSAAIDYARSDNDAPGRMPAEGQMTGAGVMTPAGQMTHKVQMTAGG